MSDANCPEVSGWEVGRLPTGVPEYVRKQTVDGVLVRSRWGRYRPAVPGETGQRYVLATYRTFGPGRHLVKVRRYVPVQPVFVGGPPPADALLRFAGPAPPTRRSPRT